MSTKALERHEVVSQIKCGKLKPSQGAKHLRISTRQMRRILVRFETDGAAGLNSKRYGTKPGNAISDAIYSKIVQLVKERYQGFGPTLLCEKLKELNDIHVSTETVRQVMIKEGCWTAHRGTPIKRHPLRTRRACFGELIQIDGSPHDWFEGRSAKCTLLVFIDDATGNLTQLRFAPTETSLGYMHCLHDHILEHGAPMALYSDKHSIFRDNGSSAAQTQFGRAAEELGIELICANSPQAKGRVERVNQTLQDRLVKEMRLRGINDIETANAWLSKYIKEFNSKFGVLADDPIDAHRVWNKTKEQLLSILSHQEKRKLSKELTISYHNRCLQIEESSDGCDMRFASITVHESFNGALEVRYLGKNLVWREIAKAVKQSKVLSSKEINCHLDAVKATRKQSNLLIEYDWSDTLINDTSLQVTPKTAPNAEKARTGFAAYPS
jgi:hypothetical protein